MLDEYGSAGDDLIDNRNRMEEIFDQLSDPNLDNATKEALSDELDELSDTVQTQLNDGFYQGDLPTSDDFTLDEEFKVATPEEKEAAKRGIDILDNDGNVYKNVNKIDEDTIKDIAVYKDDIVTSDTGAVSYKKKYTIPLTSGEGEIYIQAPQIRNKNAYVVYQDNYQVMLNDSPLFTKIDKYSDEPVTFMTKTQAAKKVREAYKADLAKLEGRPYNAKALQTEDDWFTEAIEQEQAAEKVIEARKVPELPKKEAPTLEGIPSKVEPEVVKTSAPAYNKVEGVDTMVSKKVEAPKKPKKADYPDELKSIPNESARKSARRIYENNQELDQLLQAPIEDYSKTLDELGIRDLSTYQGSNWARGELNSISFSEGKEVGEELANALAKQNISITEIDLKNKLTQSKRDLSTLYQRYIKNDVEVKFVERTIENNLKQLQEFKQSIINTPGAESINKLIDEQLSELNAFKTRFDATKDSIFEQVRPYESSLKDIKNPELKSKTQDIIEYYKEINNARKTTLQSILLRPIDEINLVNGKKFSKYDTRSAYRELESFLYRDGIEGADEYVKVSKNIGFKEIASKAEVDAEVLDFKLDIAKSIKRKLVDDNLTKENVLDILKDRKKSEDGFSYRSLKMLGESTFKPKIDDLLSVEEAKILKDNVLETIKKTNSLSSYIFQATSNANFRNREIAKVGEIILGRAEVYDEVVSYANTIKSIGETSGKTMNKVVAQKFKKATEYMDPEFVPVLRQYYLDAELIKKLNKFSANQLLNLNVSPADIKRIENFKLGFIDDYRLSTKEAKSFLQEVSKDIDLNNSLAQEKLEFIINFKKKYFEDIKLGGDNYEPIDLLGGEDAEVLGKITKDNIIKLGGDKDKIAKNAVRYQQYIPEFRIETMTEKLENPYQIKTLNKPTEELRNKTIELYKKLFPDKKIDFDSNISYEATGLERLFRQLKWYEYLEDFKNSEALFKFVRGK
jgi:hypothetical protein